MTKSKPSASSIVVPSIIGIHLIHRAQFLNTTGVGFLFAVVMVSALIIM